MDFRTLRFLKELSQWDVAVKTSISQSRISLAERGYVKFTDAEKAAISEVLGFSVDEITWKQAN